MMIVYLNGEYCALEQAHVSVMDRGFLFADGVYDVIPVYAGKLFRADAHLKRLQNSLNGIRINYHVDMDEWLTILNTLKEKNNDLGPDQVIYLQITRGSYAQRTHTFPEKTTPTLFARCSPIIKKPDDVIKKGFKAITAEDIRWHYCHIKSIALLPNVLLAQNAHEHEANETLLFRDNKLVEGASSNAFIVKNNVICTPPLNDFILGGITRQVIFDLAKKHGVTITEKDITKNDVYEADEVWITSSTREVYPIVSVDEHTIGTGKPGPVWKNIMMYYQEHINEL